MGVGEMIGLRWILWGDTPEIPADVFEETIRFVQRALDGRREPEGEQVETRP
jgi:hypothetical protein